MPDIVLATINAKWIHPSLALRLLKANLGDLEERCGILEFALRQNMNEKVKPILEAEPRLLGLSVSVWNHTATLELLKALEEKWDGKNDKETVGQRPLIVLGGPEVSWLPEQAEIFRYADYVIRGEGEESFRGLCYGFFYGTHQPGETGTKNSNYGTVFINSGDTAVTLNNIKTAYHLYTQEDLEKKLVYVEASRGCPYGCEFCQGALLKAREFPLEHFLKEMDTLIQKGVRTFKFLDRTFNLNIERAVKILDFFLDRINNQTAFNCSLNENNHPFCVHFEMVPSRFPPELKELIRRFPAGTLRLELGIQTLNPQTASLIHRSGEGGPETLEFLRRETNAIVHADLIAGLPAEDIASFGAGFDRLWQTMSGIRTETPFEIQLGILKCLPGAPIARHNEIFRMRYSEEPPYEVIETGALTAGEIDNIKNFARFWETVVNRNPFPEITPRLFPPGKPVFAKFMGLSAKLRNHFGRNWGIDRKELGIYLNEWDD